MTTAAPALRAALVVVMLYGIGLWLTERYAASIHGALTDNLGLGLAAFWITSVAAVVLPMLTNLPLVPAAVLAFGPWLTALCLLSGWVVGAVLSFALARHARQPVLRLMPSVLRHADIERLIHPRYRLASLVLLRMTFPVDVLSYALGLFSLRTRSLDVAISTAFGAAPFAVLFAWFPIWPAPAQWSALLASTGVFGIYVAWVLRRRG